MLNADDTKADKDENLESIKVTIQIRHIIRPNNKFRDSKIPKNVATPLPPLNFRNIGNK